MVVRGVGHDWARLGLEASAGSFAALSDLARLCLLELSWERGGVRHVVSGGPGWGDALAWAAFGLKIPLTWLPRPGATHAELPPEFWRSVPPGRACPGAAGHVLALWDGGPGETADAVTSARRQGQAVYNCWGAFEHAFLR